VGRLRLDRLSLADGEIDADDERGAIDRGDRDEERLPSASQNYIRRPRIA
jgi:hypothetical protein